MKIVCTKQHSSRMHTVHFRWPPLDVSTGGGGGVGPQVKKFDEVSSDDHHMSVAGGGRSHVWYKGKGIDPNASWVMVT